MYVPASIVHAHARARVHSTVFEPEHIHTRNTSSASLVLSTDIVIAIVDLLVGKRYLNVDLFSCIQTSIVGAGLLDSSAWLAYILWRCRLQYNNAQHSQRLCAHVVRRSGTPKWTHAKLNTIYYKSRIDRNIIFFFLSRPFFFYWCARFFSMSFNIIYSPVVCSVVVASI